MIFQGLSVARNCLRPETVPLTILAIKTSQKTLRAAILWHIVAQTYSIARNLRTACLWSLNLN